MDRSEYVRTVIPDLAKAALFCYHAVKTVAAESGVEISDEAAAALAAPVVQEGYRRLRVRYGDPAENEPEGGTAPEEQTHPEPQPDPERDTVVADILRLAPKAGLTKLGLAALVKPTGAQRLADVGLRHLLEIRAAVEDPKRVAGANEDGFLQYASAEIERVSSKEARSRRAAELLEQASETFGFGSEPYERLEARLTEIAARRRAA